MRAVVGTVDQLVYSLTNFVLTVLVAHYSAAREFGAFTILIATFLISSGVNRGLNSEPLVILHSSAQDGGWREAARRSLGRAILFGIVVGVGMIVAFLAVDAQVYENLVIPIGILVPVLFVQDFLRYAALAVGRPLVALLNDVTVAVVQFSATGLLVASGDRSGRLFVFSWGGGAVAGSLLGLVALGLGPAWGKRHPRFRTLSQRLGIDNLATQLQQQGTGYIVGGVSGLAATAGLRASQTVFTPPSVLSIGLLSASLPELVRLRDRSLSQMYSALIKVAVGLSSLMAVFGVVALLTPSSVGRELFGASWEKVGTFLPFIAVSQILGTTASCAAVGLRVLSDSRRILLARSAAVGFNIMTIVPATIIWGATGAAVCLSVTGAVQAVIWWVTFERAYRHVRKRKVATRLGARWQELVDSPAFVPGVETIPYLEA